MAHRVALPLRVPRFNQKVTASVPPPQNRLGREPCLTLPPSPSIAVFFFGAAALTAIGVPLLASPTAFITGNMLFKALINAPFCILYVIAAEMFPTTHRSSGIAFCSACSRIAGCFMPVILSWCLLQSTDLPYQVFAVVTGLGALLTVTNNYETLNLSLPTFSFEAGNVQEDEERTPLKKAAR